MERVKALIKDVDLDNLLAYKSVKVVKIRDRRLGVLHFLFIFAAVFFTSYQTIYIEEGWAQHDTAVGSVKLGLLLPKQQLTPPAYIPYCSPDCENYSGDEPNCNCILWDNADVVYPEEQEYSIFVATTVGLIYNQTKQNGCNTVDGDIVCTAPWSDGSFAAYNLILVNTYLLDVFHGAVAPVFYQDDLYADRLTGAWLKESTSLWGQMLDQSNNVLFNGEVGMSDQFSLDTILQAAGVTFEGIRETGGILSVSVIYGDCSKLILSSDKQSTEFCKKYKSSIVGSMNYYQYRASWIPNSDYYVTRTIYNIDQTERSVRNMTGVRVLFRVTGTQAMFSFPQLLISIVSAYVLLSFATFIVDALVLYVLPGRKLYHKAKYEVTENFGQLRKTVINEKNQKARIKKLTSMARFKSSEEVVDTLASLKVTIGTSDYDQLVMACIRVYGEELRDLHTANIFIERLETDEAKITAHILLDQLKEAYQVAIRSGEERHVRRVREECRNTNNPRVGAMCEEWIQQHAALAAAQAAVDVANAVTSIQMPDSFEDDGEEAIIPPTGSARNFDIPDYSL
eukprot:TRINITY_DN648_c0_g1_i2.p1 TRINITY_DN648_c0_g1~~TRINITY_DN648_c0_g1_i2.p1  ORF type:complete len:567 (-),score=116.47 TRINITY_DN648_c0_g1_i2:176-1876(-)